MSKKKNTKKRRKLKIKNVLKFLLFVIVIVAIVFIILNLRITNIYINGNNRVKDVEIIKIAGLEDYPSVLKNPNYLIRKKLEESDEILEAKVSKKGSKVYINVVENRPLFYNGEKDVVVMLDKKELKANKVTPYLVNYVPDIVYDKFIKAMSKIDEDVLVRISDIEYNPNNVDEERFYLTMTDGNYVYLTINSFEKINNYIEMLKQFQNKKGTLYLDSGVYFKIQE